MEIKKKTDMQHFLDYEDVKQKIVYKLINTERNKELMEDIPHIEFLDLSIIFQCLISQGELGVASILIRNTHMDLWGVTVEDLYQAAKENTQELLPYVIKPVTEILCDTMQSGIQEGVGYEQCMEDLDDNISMFVLSNRNMVAGASCMLYPNLIGDFADAIGSDLYIILSSIHELLLLPTENDGGFQRLRA